MTLKRFKKYFISAAVFLALAGITVPSRAASTSIKNIVPVHGAFVDGSGWQPVYGLLVPCRRIFMR